MHNTSGGDPIIEEIEKRFYLPQDGRRRHIYVILPPDYYRFTGRRYPVIYMHDGQNLFGHGPFGSWDVDKGMLKLHKEGSGDFIIVAIDHASEHRIEEFMPYKYKEYSGKRGKTYSEFVSVELKHFIDHNYRTMPDRMHTAMGGSSMGGLITIYAGIMFPHVFGKLLVFSPSLWAAPKIYFDAPKYLSNYPSDMYLYAGGKESQYMVPNIKRFRSSLLQSPIKNKHLNIQLSIDPEGQHNEFRWGVEFPKAIEWLFFEDVK